MSHGERVLTLLSQESALWPAQLRRRGGGRALAASPSWRGQLGVSIDWGQPWFSLWEAVINTEKALELLDVRALTRQLRDVWGSCSSLFYEEETSGDPADLLRRPSP